MEGNSKESDDKDNTGQQNNNSIETESNQQNCSTNEKELKNESTPSKKINNDSNGCDNGNSETNSFSKQKDTNHENVKANDDKEVTDMEMGSPEKQLNTEGKKDKPSSNSPPKSESNVNKEANIDFKVIYNKKKYDISVSPDTDIGALKTHLHPIIDIPPAMMKVIFSF